MKIGRNDSCPCGSGKKYKRCCAALDNTGLEKKKAPEASKKVTLWGAIKACQAIAQEKRVFVQQLGVFILYADRNGDAWVLEVTDSDCVQIASAGEVVEVPLEENDETIEMDWSHRFQLVNKTLEITGYRDNKTTSLKDAPTQQISATRRKIVKRLSPELLEQVHIDS